MFAQRKIFLEGTLFRTHHFGNSYSLMNIYSLHQRQNNIYSWHNNDFIS